LRPEETPRVLEAGINPIKHLKESQEVSEKLKKIKKPTGRLLPQNHMLKYSKPKTSRLIKLYNKRKTRSE